MENSMRKSNPAIQSWNKNPVVDVCREASAVPPFSQCLLQLPIALMMQKGKIIYHKTAVTQKGGER